MTLLMADDDRDDREMMSAAFAQECPDHTLKFVCDGEELLECLKKQLASGRSLPDLILLDLNMPKIDGKRALKELKEDPQLRHIPVVIYSTSDSKDDISYALSMGAKEYFTKPFGFNQMLKVCKLICERVMAEA